MMTTLAEASQALAEKKISSVELTELCIQRIRSLNPAINAVLHLNEAKAREAARDADQQRQRGDSRPLLGIPVLHKDIFLTHDMPTTCGSKMLKDYMSPFDATVVARCDAAGMIRLGKTNMDEFAMGSSNETSYFGPTRNPWRYDCVPGGSSGGSAAAVASGMALVATASDTGGSIRQPASLCGVTGLKPSYGRLSRYGMIAFSSSLDQAGTLTRDAKDAAMMLNALQGKDPRDATTAQRPYEDFTAQLEQSLKGRVLGIPKQFFGPELDPAIAARIQEAIEVYQDLGADIREIDLPSLRFSVPCYYVIQPAEASSNLARFDGIRYGHRSDAPSLQELYTDSRHDGFGLEVKRRILLGTFVLSSGHKDAFYHNALRARTTLSHEFNQAFETVDLIIGPTSPTTAFRLGQRMDDPIAMYLSDIFTICANIASLPAVSIPCGLDQDLPVGLQLIGKRFDEATMLACAHQYQCATSWHKQSPLYAGYTL